MRNKAGLILFMLAFLNAGSLFASDGDGFGPGEKLESKYFTVYYSSRLNLTHLSMQLDIRASDRLSAGGDAAGGDTLPGALDTLFLRVGDILDMNLYSFHGNIKICNDLLGLKNIYSNLFGADLGDRISFYASELNTIYISGADFKRGVLGHEIAHALICRYFVVPPSVKIQELLAMYVEYQLRKI